MTETCNFNIKQPIRTIKFGGLKIGADSSFHFLSENENLSRPYFVLELSVFDLTVNSHIVKDVYEKYFDNKSELVNQAQLSECDILGLKFNIAEDDFKTQIKEAQKLLKSLLPHIKKPLMIRGINNSTVDEELIPALAEVLDREAIIAFVDEKTYKKVVPIVIKGNHILVIRTPIDINLAKEMNILTMDMGLNPDRIMIDTDMGGLGYGLEYGYSIMERIKLAAFEGDNMLNMPLIAFAGEESLKTKETKSDMFSQSWGDFKERSKMFEISTAVAVVAAGANVVVLNHPETIKIMKGLVK